MRKLLLFAFVWLSFSHAPCAFGQECDSIFSTHRERVDSRAFPTERESLATWQTNLFHRGKLIYGEKTDYKPEGAFLASNEGDWAPTQFDHKDSDLMVAFGTNSAWEIAVDKNVHELVIADWAPLPLLAQAYVIEPLMRISSNAQEFLGALNGYLPRDVTHESVSNLLSREGSQDQLLLPPDRVEKFLHYLSTRPEITDTDLKFLSHYFWTRSNVHALGTSPFRDTRHPMFMHFLHFYSLRYQDPATWSMSVLHNPERFAKLRALYKNGHVRYAQTDVASPKFYDVIARKFPRARNMTLSLTNIFSMAYHEHQGPAKRLFLRRLFESRGRKPLTVFETTGDRPPHKFLRYDIETPDDVP